MVSTLQNGANGAHGTEATPSKLWTHPNPETTRLWDFLQRVNKENGFQMQSYEELLEWSTENIAAFWTEVWDYVGVRVSQPYHEVCHDSNIPDSIIGLHDCSHSCLRNSF